MNEETKREQHVTFLWWAGLTALAAALAIELLVGAWPGIIAALIASAIVLTAAMRDKVDEW